MQILSNIILGFILWSMVGDIILGFVDKNLETTTWKRQAVWWLILLVNFLWPIVTALYLKRNKKYKIK